MCKSHFEDEPRNYTKHRIKMLSKKTGNMIISKSLKCMFTNKEKSTVIVGAK